jgi:hypothetical protein
LYGFQVFSFISSRKAGKGRTEDDLFASIIHAVRPEQIEGSDSARSPRRFLSLIDFYFISGYLSSSPHHPHRDCLVYLDGHQQVRRPMRKNEEHFFHFYTLV